MPRLLYAVYVIERMDVCVSSLRDLAHFTNEQAHRENFSEEENLAISTWRDDLLQLLLYLESIAWENYYHELVRADSASVQAYQVRTLASYHL